MGMEGLHLASSPEFSTQATIRRMGFVETPAGLNLMTMSWMGSTGMDISKLTLQTNKAHAQTHIYTRIYIYIFLAWG